VAYGFSLGGAYATYASRYFGIPIILQNTLTTVPDIIANVFPIPTLSCTRNAIARSYLDKGAMPPLESYGLFESTQNVPVNSFDNIENLKATTAPVMIIYAEDDILMGKASRGEELYRARYGNQKAIIPSLCVQIPGDHVSVFLEHKEAKDAVLKFMDEINRRHINEKFKTTKK
jgi:uncharacterized protein